jgi:hypothetical protein
VTSGRPARHSRAVVLLGVLACLAPACGCARAVDGAPTPATPQVAAAATPGSAAELEALIVSTVPSGLPRLPDQGLDPPAGEKTVEDVAGYSEDPEREREVLEEYGYRYGWERFWGTGGPKPMTGVFVDQFEHRSGAAAYAADLAHNEAQQYAATLMENAPGLPGGCHLLAVEDADPRARLAGPAALAWCGHGVFSVSVTAVADSVDAAEKEVRSVLGAQLDRLPPK